MLIRTSLRLAGSATLDGNELSKSLDRAAIRSSRGRLTKAGLTRLEEPASSVPLSGSLRLVDIVRLEVWGLIV